MRSFFSVIVLAVCVAAQDLKINVTKAVQCDRKTKIGDMIDVNYNGTLTNGTLFDSSRYTPSTLSGYILS